MDDAELLAKFERSEIPRVEWTHQAHVQIGYLYLRSYLFEDALEMLTRGIKALNAANKVDEGPRSGYNQTITVAFLRLIDLTIRTRESGYPSTSEEFCRRNPQLMCPQILRLFYSPLALENPMTKTMFVEPDLAQFPNLLLEPSE